MKVHSVIIGFMKVAVQTSDVYFVCNSVMSNRSRWVLVWTVELCVCADDDLDKKINERLNALVELSLNYHWNLYGYHQIKHLTLSRSCGTKITANMSNWFRILRKQITIIVIVIIIPIKPSFFFNLNKSLITCKKTQFKNGIFPSPKTQILHSPVCN